MPVLGQRRETHKERKDKHLKLETDMKFNALPWFVVEMDITVMFNALLKCKVETDITVMFNALL